MKKIIFLLLPLMLLITSCEDVIDVNVKQGEPKLIVDAFVNNMDKPQHIRLTKSNPYFAKPGTEPGVVGATVAIVDTSTFKLFLFADSGDGHYVFTPDKTTGDTFTVGKNYALFVIHNSDTFVSFSKMNPTAHLDSIKLKVETGSTIGFQPGNYAELAARDRVGQGNTYWIKTFVNDTFKSRIGDINLAYDMSQSPNGQDGGEFIWPIKYGQINNFQKPYKTGDKVRIEIHSLTVEIFYFMNLFITENQNGGLFATPPANIGSNIVNLNPKKKSAVGGFFCMSDVAVAERIFP